MMSSREDWFRGSRPHSRPVQDIGQRRTQLGAAPASRGGVDDHQVPPGGPGSLSVELDRDGADLTTEAVAHHGRSDPPTGRHGQTRAMTFTLRARSNDEGECSRSVAWSGRREPSEHRPTCDPFQHPCAPTRDPGTIRRDPLRPTGGPDRGGDGTSRSPDRLGSTCGAGSRACGHDAGCSADRYASP